MGKRVEDWLKRKNQRGNETWSLENLKDMYFLDLSNKICQLFDYEGLPFPQHELEYRAIIDGYAGAVNDSKCGIMTAWGSMSKTTQYNDIFTQFTYAAPTAKGGTVEIGKNAVILRNTSLSQSCVILIDRFAELLAHNSISLKMALINSRYQDIIKVYNAVKKEAVEEWYQGLYRGQLCAILDEMPMSEFREASGQVEAMELTKSQEVDFTRFTELENELWRQFYRHFGVRWNKDKKANLVSGEVEQDNMLLQFNIYDMLKCRKEFCKELKRVFGIDVTVKLAISIESEESYDNNSDGILENDK